MTTTLKNLSLSITVESLTLTPAAAQSPLAAALMAALNNSSHVHVEARQCRDDDEDAQPEAADEPEGNGTTAPAPAPEITRTNVVAFLTGDARYSSRTFQAICKHFQCSPDGGALRRLLDLMVEDGDLTTLRRRADGVTLYKAA